MPGESCLCDRAVIPNDNHVAVSAFLASGISSCPPENQLEQSFVLEVATEQKQNCM
jgi:hypothetical protein